MTRTLRAALAALLLLAQPALAAPVTLALPDKADSVIVPDGSGLKFAKFSDADTATFTGKLTLSGVFYYGDNEYNDDPKTVQLTLYFMPDAASVARLPYLKTRGKAEAVFLTNDAAFSAAVLSKAQAATLSKKATPQPYATGHATLVVDSFSIGIVCDTKSFSARFVSAARPVTVTMGPFDSAGC